MQEKQSNAWELNGKNNKTIIKAHSLDSTIYKKYVGLSRTVLRIVWFMEFIGELFQRLYDDPTNNKSLTQSYEAVLAPRHSFIVK